MQKEESTISLAPFVQQALPTVALDTNYNNVGSVSPLKYRPDIDMDNIGEPKNYMPGDTIRSNTNR